MDVYLTIKEQEREKNLFAPHEATYKLPEEAIDLWTFNVQVSENEYVVQQPLSC
jgi:hypothetical protein